MVGEGEGLRGANGKKKKEAAARFKGKDETSADYSREKRIEGFTDPVSAGASQAEWVRVRSARLRRKVTERETRKRGPEEKKG